MSTGYEFRIPRSVTRGRVCHNDGRHSGYVGAERAAALSPMWTAALGVSVAGTRACRTWLTAPTPGWALQFDLWVGGIQIARKAISFFQNQENPKPELPRLA